MAIKTITITEEAYRKLARRKRGHESLSEAINRVLGGPSALVLDGLLDPFPEGQVGARIRRVRRGRRRSLDDVQGLTDRGGDAVASKRKARKGEPNPR